MQAIMVPGNNSRPEGGSQTIRWTAAELFMLKSEGDAVSDHLEHRMQKEFLSLDPFFIDMYADARNCISTARNQMFGSVVLRGHPWVVHRIFAAVKHIPRFGPVIKHLSEPAYTDYATGPAEFIEALYINVSPPYTADAVPMPSSGFVFRDEYTGVVAREKDRPMIPSS